MDFSMDYILENAIVRLEPLRELHISKLEGLVDDPDIWKFFLGRSDGSSNFGCYIKDTIQHRNEKAEYPFAVYDKRVGQYAGSTRFFDYSEELKNIRLGYSWHGKPYRGSGLNKNCKYLLFEFALEKLNLCRVGLGAHAENGTSINAMKSIGCTHEGTLRNFFPSIKGEGRADALLFSMTKEDWVNGAKNQLKKKL
ncbi:MAG: GNAT family protein [Bacteroidota bacterium]